MVLRRGAADVDRRALQQPARARTATRLTSAYVASLSGLVFEVTSTSARCPSLEVTGLPTEATPGSCLTAALNCCSWSVLTGPLP